MIVIMDCIMTFFGSSANDAAFNASINDHTNPSNRGKVESVLSILPLIALIAVTVVGGIFGVGGEDKEAIHWDFFFYLFGGLTLVIGVICLFIYPKDVCKSDKETKYFQNIIYGFRPKVIKDNVSLYLALIAFMIFNIAIQIFMPYFMVYIQEVLYIKNDSFTITLGIVLVVASIITVGIGAFMDKIGRNKIIFPSLGAGVVGAIIMFFVRDQIGVIIGGIILMAGYLISTAVLFSKVRDYIPQGKEGVFQGVRMVFVVMIPMIVGPYIGSGVSYINGEMWQDPTYLQWSIKPNEYIFLFAAITMLLVLIPLIFLVRREKQNEQASK